MYEGTPPWDIGRPQHAVVRLAEAGAFEGEVLDAGCGTGENSIYLASRGLVVLGVDGAWRAIEKAEAKANERRSKAVFAVGDALKLAALGRTFDRVLDCGLFHTFDDTERAAYVRGLSGILKPGGRLFLLCFSEHEPGDWGPRRVTQAALRAAFTPSFEVEAIAPEAFESHVGSARAWLATVARAGPPG